MRDDSSAAASVEESRPTTAAAVTAARRVESRHELTGYGTANAMPALNRDVGDRRHSPKQALGMASPGAVPDALAAPRGACYYLWDRCHMPWGGFYMLRRVTPALMLFLVATGVRAQIYATGDPRPVRTPTYPPICRIVRAQFSTASRANPPTSDDTARIQEALNDCADSGMSVVLMPSRAGNAFYSGELAVTGEGLVVAAGSTLEGNSSYASQSELLDVTGRDAFIGGEGAIDGRGDLITGGTPRLIEATDTEG